MTGWIVQNQKTVILNIVDEEGSLDPQPNPEQPIFANPQLMAVGVRSFAGLPLIAKDQFLGVLYLQNKQPNVYAGHLDMMTTFANQAAVAIENARLHEQTQRHAAELEIRVEEATREVQQRVDELDTLYRVSQAINASQAIDTMLQIIVDNVVESIPADRATIILMDTDKKQVPWFVKSGPGLEDVVEVSFDELWSGLSGWALRERKPVISPKGDPDPRESPEVQQRRVETNCGAIAVVPLLYRKQLMGTLTAINRPDQSDFTPEAVEMMTALSNQAAIAIRNTRLYDETAQRARELTILNDLSRKLAVTLTVDEVLAEAYSTAVQLMEISTFYVTIYNAEQDEIRTALRIVDGEEVNPRPARRGGLTDYIIETKHPLLLSDNVIERVNTLGIPINQLTPGRVSESWVGVPILLGDQEVGTMVALSYTTPRAYEQSHCDLLSAIANQTAIAISNARSYAAANRRVEELAVLNKFSRKLAVTLETDEILQEVYQRVVQILDISNFYITFYDEDTDTITSALRVVDGRFEAPQPTPRGGLTDYLLQNREPLLFKNNPLKHAQDLEILPVNLRPDRVSKSWVGVPILLGDQILGTMVALSYERSFAYDERHCDLLSSMATQAAIAINNAKLYNQARLNAEKLTVLHEIGNRIAASLALDETLQTIVSETVHLVAADRSIILMVDMTRSELVHTVGHGYSPEVLAHHTFEEIMDGISGWVIENQEPTISESIQSDDRNRKTALASAQKDNPACAAIAPLLVENQVIGTLTAIRNLDESCFGQDDLDLVSMLAGQAAIAIQNAQLFEEAQTATRTKSMFLANMSHEIRTPLNAILGYSQIMQRDSTLNPNQQQSLATIGRSGEHLLALLNDILEMSKIEAQQVVLMPETFDLHALLLDIELMFAIRVKTKGLFLSTDISPDLPQFVYGDEGKIRQVLINLMGNAIKFTQQGGIMLRTMVVNQDLAAEDNFGVGQVRIQFEVEDTGIGIPEDEIDLIFGAFEQATSGQKAGEGTGLGLAISQEYARMMGGEISVRSAAGVGSTFSFTIQTQLGEEGAVVLSISQERVIGIQPGQGPFRALIVDDRDTNRDLLNQMLAAVGFETRSAVNGLEAVEIHKAWQPQLILMDLVMPEMDGREASRTIRAKNPGGEDTVIIAVTASVSEDERYELMKKDVNDFMRKPFRESDLFARIGKHLEIDFVYEESETQAEEQPMSADAQTMIKGALQSLPPEQLLDFQSAIEALDTEKLLQLVNQAADFDPQIADYVRSLIDQFDFDTLEEIF